MPDEKRAELMMQSLEVVADTGQDIVPIFFDRFFAAYPEQRRSFYHPNVTCGAMVNEILESLMGMATGETWVPGSIQSLVVAHRSFGDIPLDQYSGLLDIMIKTLAEIAGPRWTPEFEAAWQEQADELKQIIAASW